MFEAGVAEADIEAGAVRFALVGVLVLDGTRREHALAEAAVLATRSADPATAIAVIGGGVAAARGGECGTYKEEDPKEEGGPEIHCLWCFRCC